MKRFLHFIQAWLPVILWCGLIFYLSSVPYLRITAAWWDYPLRKMAHMLEYGVLARLLTRAFTASTFWSWKKIFAVSLFLCFLYASSDEVHQRYVRGRHGAPTDVAVDIIGAWLALGLRP